MTHLRVLSVCAAIALFLSAQVSKAQAYSVYGPSAVDLAGCSPVTPSTGVTSSTFWVHRAPTITGPTGVYFTNLPAGVTSSITPSTLTYPGWVIGQQITASFTSATMASVPDTVVTMNVADGFNTVKYDVLLHGTCPRSNKAFTIRGEFLSNHQGVGFPIEGATVHIYRDVSWQVDPWVAKTKTKADGTFEANVWTNVEGTYYAKLELNDEEGVYLHNWWSPEIESYNSVNRGANDEPIIDVGTTWISRDGGTGTPKTAIWQGGRAAFQEFIQTNGRPPPTGDYEIVIQSTASDIVWTARSTTNWEDNSWTAIRTPIASGQAGFHPYFSQFTTYYGNFHEFGHALRHTIDGDINHFNADSARWTYARVHYLCGSPPGYVETEGFGFNEGWSDYWARDLVSEILGCGVDLTNLTIEGSVAYDLHLLARGLQTCMNFPGNEEARVRAQRRSLFDVLNRGQNIIHSQGEFRSNFNQQFPSCPLPVIGDTTGNLARRSATIPRPRNSYLKYYNAQIAFRLKEVSTLRAELLQAARLAGPDAPCRKDCDRFVTAKLRPHRLKAQLDYSSLVLAQMQRRLGVESRLKSRDPKASIAAAEAARRQSLAFDASVRRIVLRYLTDSSSSLDRYAAQFRSERVSQISADLKRRSRTLQLRGPINNQVYAILDLGRSNMDDAVGSIRPR